MKILVVAYIILIAGYFYYLNSFHDIAFRQLNQVNDFYAITTAVDVNK